MKYKIIRLLLIVGLPAMCYGGDQDERTSQWSIQGEILTQTTGLYSSSLRIPGLRRQLSDGRGLKAGLEYAWLKNNRRKIFQDLTLMTYWHPAQETGISAGTSCGYRRFISGVYIEGLVGIGYFRTTFSRPRLWQDESGEAHSEVFRMNSWAPSLALGIGYRIASEWDVYLRYGHQTQLPDQHHGMRHHRTLGLGIRRQL